MGTEAEWTNGRWDYSAESRDRIGDIWAIKGPEIQDAAGVYHLTVLGREPLTTRQIEQRMRRMSRAATGLRTLIEDLKELDPRTDYVVARWEYEERVSSGKWASLRRELSKLPLESLSGGSPTPPTNS